MKNEKKKYQAPKLYRVKLDHTQAILATCSTGTTSLSNTTGTLCNTGCRRATSTTNANSTAAS